MRNLTIIILAFLTITFGIYGYMQSVEANRQAELAKEGERRALVAEEDALHIRDRAEKDRQDAIRSRQEYLQLEAELNDCRKKQSKK